MLRIVAGKFRGSLIEQPDINITRVTTDRVREAIFNCLQKDIKESIVLDLFSGSGALAIEAISRGAIKAICVDDSVKVIKIINNNISKLKINNIDVYNQDCFAFLRSKKGTVYNLIFLDPPYQETSTLNNVLEILSKDLFLDKYGKIILETNSENFSEIIIPQNMIINKIKEYGNIFVIFINNIL